MTETRNQRKTALILCEGLEDKCLIDYCLEKIRPKCDLKNIPSINSVNLKGGDLKSKIVKFRDKIEVVDFCLIVLDRDRFRGEDEKELMRDSAFKIRQQNSGMATSFIIWELCLEAELLRILSDDNYDYTKQETKKLKGVLRKKFPGFFKNKKVIDKKFLDKELTKNKLCKFLKSKKIKPLFKIFEDS